VQDQINERSVALSIKAAKLTGRALAQAIQTFLKKVREPSVTHGKQSIKSLTQQGASLTNVEITGDNIGSFKKTARKYNIDFALKRDDSTSPPKWLVFFKAKDSDALMAALKEYSKSNIKVKSDNEPSLLDSLEQEKELVSRIPAPIKTRQQGEREL
jgi:hypothetical protein